MLNSICNVFISSLWDIALFNSKTKKSKSQSVLLKHIKPLSFKRI